MCQRLIDSIRRELGPFTAPLDLAVLCNDDDKANNYSRQDKQKVKWRIDCEMKCLLVVSLYFCLVLVVVVDSLSLKHSVKPLHDHHLDNRRRFWTLPSLSSKRQHSSLVLLRGGGGGGTNAATDEESSATKGGIMSALDPRLLTGALVAMGQFYSSSLESSPILTKSVTVRKSAVTVWLGWMCTCTCTCTCAVESYLSVCL